MLKLKIGKSCRFPRHFFFFTEVLPWKKYVFYFPLLVLLSTKFAQDLLVFCCMICIFRFLVSNKNTEIVHVFFVYFVGFEVLSSSSPKSCTSW